jgi:hypothetical protein
MTLQEPVGFTLELDGMQLTVRDTKVPLWNGEYHEGMLTIYTAEMSGEKVVPDSVAFIAVYCETGTTEDFLTFNWYHKDTSTYLILNELQEKVFDQYCQVKAQLAISTAVASSKGQTLH